FTIFISIPIDSDVDKDPTHCETST
ncbi:unnamed protein product, partial [Rotaria magnacalcarata]